MEIMLVMILVILGAIISYILIKQDYETSKWMNKQIREGKTIVVTRL